MKADADLLLLNCRTLSYKRLITSFLTFEGN